MAHPCLTIRRHIKPKAIYKRYISCRDGIEKRYWQVIWLLAREKNPLKAEEVAEVAGCHPDRVRRLARRYNREGPRGLIDKRKRNGKKKILSTRQQSKLKRVLHSHPADGGLWTGPKVAIWMSEQLETPVSAVTGWHYLKWSGLSLQVPRPHHVRGASVQKQTAFKKNFKKRSKP